MLARKILVITISLLVSLVSAAGELNWFNGAGNQSATYDRGEDFPNMYVGPLQYVPTSTGHSVAVRVSYPADSNGDPQPGRFPVILVHGAYNATLLSIIQVPNAGFLGAPDPFMVKRGYVQVSVDALGTGASEGGWELLGRDEQIAFGDIVDWIKLQPWYDGNLGVSGISYMAMTAVATAKQRPDDVKAMFCGGSMGDAMRGTGAPGGMVNAVILSYITPLTHVASTSLNFLNELQWPELAEKIAGATSQHVEQIDKFYLPTFTRAMNGDPEITYDGDFWRSRSPLQNVEDINAATLVIGSLSDVFQRASPMFYDALKHKVDTRLLIFNGTHIGGYLQGLPGTPETVPLLNLQLQWFDHYLKGMDTRVQDIPAVTQYVKNYQMGPRKGFATTTDWPHPAAQPERWYLHGSGYLSKWAPFFTEKSHKMEAAKFADVNVGRSEQLPDLFYAVVTPNDGTDCSPSYSQWTLGFAGISFEKCFRDNRELEKRAVNYQTARFFRDYYINGPIQADLWISSTTPDAVVSVRIDEVTLLGQVIPITNGILLASARAVDPNRSRYIDGVMVQPFHYLTQETEQLLVPNEVTKLQVEIFPTSALIRAGSRLRVSIAPSNQAQGVLSFPRRANVEGGVTTIHNSPRYPSSVVVPVVPSSELN